MEQLDLFIDQPKPEPETWLEKNIRKPGGCTCPVCGQHAQLYRRTITGPMAKGLVLIYRYFQTHTREKPLHVEGYFKRLNIGSSIRGDIP